MTIRTTFSRVFGPAALGLVVLLAVTACGRVDRPESEQEVEQAVEGQSSEAPQTPVDSFPVGEPFGEAVWSVEVSLPDTGSTVKMRDNPVKVRGDRLLVEYETVDGSRGVIAFTPDGDEVWRHEVPQGAAIGVLDSTVAILEAGTVEGSGLEKDQNVVTLTLLAHGDGSTVAEVQDPGIAQSVSEFGEVLLPGDPLRYVTEDGRIEEAGRYDEQFESAIPFLEEGLADIVPIDPAIEELDDAFQTEIRVIARKQNAAVLQVFYGALAESVTYAVNAESGEVIGRLDCDLADHLDSDTNVAHSSPNGEYGVLESYWISGDEARCYAGDGDTKGVEFSAVADDGSAYGTTVEDSAAADPELVVVTADGSVDVSPLPEGASAPVGIMEGGMAIHVSGNTITGNPVK